MKKEIKTGSLVNVTMSRTPKSSFNWHTHPGMLGTVLRNSDGCVHWYEVLTPQGVVSVHTYDISLVQ